MTEDHADNDDNTELAELVKEPENRIRGKVAEVVSDREVILNRGSEHGVRPGMYFAILDPDAVGITDPETGETLGDIRIVKIVVRATDVAPKITLARTFRTRRVNIGGSGGLGLGSIARAMQEPEYVEQVEKLTLDRNSPRKIDPNDSVVGRGDPFELATPAEVEDIRSITVWEPPAY
ncbi:hypothetical protein GCM10009785_20640 [Brooklawnia cerclae]|uniref:Uncharacterized protein n=1 Tax=Brooklawnia cerclae TaxID=349934 RepID=A0ABX0SJG3_9ACTN|nr:hypothetical protein [Brooklawnia cerclae]NIH57195.1 hypothetical protein [Brooklawnia cerclae]